MGNWFAPNVGRFSNSLEGTESPRIRLSLSFHKHNRDQLQIQTHSEISRFAICNDLSHTAMNCHCQPPENVAYEDHEQQEGDNVDCDPTFEASCSLSEPHLLTQDLSDLVREFNLSEK
jgi:hypothetical protein